MRASLPAFLFLGHSLAAQTWVQLPDFPGIARDDATSFTIGSKVYVGTGMDAGFQLTNDWWCFDMQTETWAPITAMPTTPRQYCTGFTIVDTGYVFGGVDANGALDQLWAYHPNDNTWEQKTSLPAEARYAAVAVTGYFWNAIVATGMLASGTPTKEAWKYDAPSDTWAAMTPVPGPSRHRAACFLDDGGMLIAGGADSTFAPLSDAWSYPIWFETGEWYPKPALPAPRFSADGSGGTATAIVGGATGSGVGMVQNNAWRYAFTSWPTLPDFAGGPRRGGVAATGAQNAWASTIYYGTGSDNIQRYADWWKLEYSVGMQEATLANFTVGPVPADDHLNVHTPASANDRTWHVLSIDGRMISQGLLSTTSTSVPTAALSDGTYILRLVDGHSVSGTRFTVQH